MTTNRIEKNVHLRFDGVGINDHTLDVVQLRVVLKMTKNNNMTP